MNTKFLEQIREDWEMSLTEVAKNDKNERRLLVVLKDQKKRYHCHRYYQIDGVWSISADLQGTTDPEAVMRWLCDF